MKPNIKKWITLTGVFLLVGVIIFAIIVNLSQPGLFGQATSIAVKPTVSSSTWPLSITHQPLVNGDGREAITQIAEKDVVAGENGTFGWISAKRKFSL